MACIASTSAYAARVAPAAAKFQAKARVARVAPALRKYAPPPTIIRCAPIIPGELYGWIEFLRTCVCGVLQQACTLAMGWVRYTALHRRVGKWGWG